MQRCYILASNLATRIIEGLNVTHLFSLVCSKIFIQFNILGIGLILNGRITSAQFTQRLVINALCVSSFSNRILDIGYISSVTSLGLVGVKVGTML